MRKLLWLGLLLIPLSVYASNSTIGFVSESSLNNTQFIYNGNSTALGINPSQQTACPNYSYCVPFAGKTLSGNLAILPYTYAFSSAVTATASDAGGDSFTCFDGSVDAATTIPSSGNYHPHNGLCYARNSAAGSPRGIVTFGTTPVTNVAADASQWYNVLNTSDPVDAHRSAAGASSTTANAVSVTTTAPGDLIYVHVCRTGTPSTTSFAAGPGFTLLTTDIHDGCATEYQIQTTAGSITPTMTMATASTYVEQVFAFKAASAGAGSAPTGTYMERMMSWSMPQGQSTTNWPLQFPSAGQLLLESNVCGFMIPSVTPPTDVVNTWHLTGINSTLSGNGAIDGEYYVTGASPNPTGLITTHTTGTGDCGFKLYSFAGAAGATFSQWSPYGFSTPTNQYPVATVTTTWNPNVNGPALWILTGSQANNTGIGMVTPSSGCQWTGGSYGGMNINGPEPIDQNNMWAVCYENTTGNQTVAYLEAGTNPNGQAADLVSFKAGAVPAPPTNVRVVQN
jgi:hypothetical protein